MAHRIVNTAASLAELGVKKGDIIAIVSENRSEVVIVSLAALCSGATITFINSAYTKGEIQHVTSISKPKYVFLSPNAYKNHYESVRAQAFVSKILVFGDSPSTEVISYNELCRQKAVFSSYRPVDFFGRVETALILYSSGTTGLPKGAKLTHTNLIAAAQQKEPCPDISMLTVAPWCNTLGYITMMRALVNGKEVIYLQKFQEKQYLETVQKYKAQSLLVAPPLVVLLSKSSLVDKYDLSSVQVIYSGGAPLDGGVIQQVKKRLPKLHGVLQGYGMTEATGAVTEETTTDAKKDSVGKVVQGNILKIVDVETRKTLGPGQPGEVCLNGVVLFDGYIGKAKNDDFDEDGFYRSGDIAYYDEEGYFFIIDRIKELIKYKAWQVSPAEIEAVLLEHPAVRDAGVTGVPDPLAGELPTAFVVKQPSHEVTEKDLINFVASKVSPWKQLRGGVRFVNEIPKTGSGKILRRIIRDMLKAQSKL
ncbi:luciferin 4-monooxygenase-like isoform X2 [Choristoneura fumiferana]